MKKPKRSRVFEMKYVIAHTWDTFLRVQPPSTVDAARADDGWLSASGAYWTAPVVLGLLRDEVLPLVRRLKRDSNLAGYFFLVHDYQSGVPVSADDKNSYIHLRLMFNRSKKYVAAKNSPWEMTRPIILGGNGPPSGVDERLFLGHPGESTKILLVHQSRWILHFIELHKHDADLGKMVMQMRQFLHYFANMTQMRVA